VELANEKFALDEDVLHSTCPPGSTPKDIHRSFKIKRQHREQRKKLTSPAHRGYTDVRQPCVCFWWQEFSFLDSSDVSSIDNYLTAAGTWVRWVKPLERPMARTALSSRIPGARRRATKVARGMSALGDRQPWWPGLMKTKNTPSNCVRTVLQWDGSRTAVLWEKRSFYVHLTAGASIPSFIRRPIVSFSCPFPWIGIVLPQASAGEA